MYSSVRNLPRVLLRHLSRPLASPGNFSRLIRRRNIRVNSCCAAFYICYGRLSGANLHSSSTTNLNACLPFFRLWISEIVAQPMHGDLGLCGNQTFG